MQLICQLQAIQLAKKVNALKSSLVLQLTGQQ